MSDQLLFVISTAVSRVGAVLILLFLVQIFVSGFRYLMRLAAFYNARADALELLGKIDEKEYRALSLALSPDSLDFGELPKTPTEQVAALAAEVARVANAAQGKGTTG
jgi:uncharacterized membrane protein YcjF (UPF0283 family)